MFHSIKSWEMTEFVKDTRNKIYFHFLLKKSRGQSVNSQNWTSETNYTQTLHFMPFVDTNSHLTTKLYNFDIKCESNSESNDQHIFFGPSLGLVRTFIYGWRFFQQEWVFWGWLAGPSQSKGEAMVHINATV